MQLLADFTPHIVGAAFGAAGLAGIGYALYRRRSRKRVKADLRYEVADGPIKRSLALRSSYGDTKELVAELRRVADGLQDDIIQAKTGISSQQDFNLIVGIIAAAVGIVASGGDIEVPPATVPWDDGLDPNPLGPNPYDPNPLGSEPYMPWSESPYIPREPSPWDEWDQPNRSSAPSEPETEPSDTDARAAEEAVEKFVTEVRQQLCDYHKQQGLGAVMLAYLPPDPKHDFKGGVLDVRYDLPSSVVQSHFSRIEKYLAEFGQFATERMASLQSGNEEDLQRFMDFMNRACREFHASLPMINSVVDFKRDGGLDDHIVSEFRIYKDLASKNASAKKTQERLKNHRRLAIADAALDSAEHLPSGLGCFVGLTSLFYGALTVFRVKLGAELRAKPRK